MSDTERGAEAHGPVTVDTPYAEDPSSPVVTDLPGSGDAAAERYEEPADFDAFWRETLGQAREPAARLCCAPADVGLRTVTVEDVSFPGWAGQPVRGWLVRPASSTGLLPLVVQYTGYGGGRGLPAEHLFWASAGYAHFVMDTRGQGWGTPDAHTTGTGPDGSHVTRGIVDPRDYYYRRLITDAVRAVDCLADDTRVDRSRIVVSGTSQGGGLALAVAALHPDVALLLCNIPFGCHWARAVRVADRGPYAEVNRFCATYRAHAAAALSTLRYFDGLAFAARACAPALFSMAARDRVCPPSTVHAAYERYAGPKRLVSYEHNDHEGGGVHHQTAALAWVHDVLRRRGS